MNCLPKKMKSGETRYTYWLLHQKLYEALRELLASQALLKDELGCECERCNQARYHAYQALGNAEGRVALKAGDPGSA